MREIKRIQVGPVDNGKYVGYTAEYKDGTKDSHFFDPETALRLADLLREAVEVLEKQQKGWADTVRAEDAVKIKLQ